MCSGCARSRPTWCTRHFSHDHSLARLAGRRPLVRSIHAPRSLRWSTPGANAFTVPPGLSHTLKRPWVELPALVDERFTPDREGARAELGLCGAPLVGMISTFQPSRRHGLALRAFVELSVERPEAQLVLVGDGGLESKLRAQVAELGLSRSVHFAGYQSGARFVRHVQACDEVWVLGLGNDFSARAAAQARACGARVLGVAEGALPLLADAVVEPDLSAIVRAALEGARRTVPLSARTRSPASHACQSLRDGRIGPVAFCPFAQTQGGGPKSKGPQACDSHRDLAGHLERGTAVPESKNQQVHRAVREGRTCLLCPERRMNALDRAPGTRKQSVLLRVPAARRLSSPARAVATERSVRTRNWLLARRLLTARPATIDGPVSSRSAT